jgi:polygalacturonase
MNVTNDKGKRKDMMTHFRQSSSGSVPRVRFTVQWLFSLILIATGLSSGAGASTSNGVFDVHAYGAVGDAKTLDTKALQAAIDACAQSGGGRVVIAGGTFLSGTLVLKSHVILDVEAGATLLGSTKLVDYPIHIAALRSYTDNYTDKSLIYAEKQENIGITGHGVIDGQGGDKAFQEKPFKQRPFLIRVIDCRNVVVSGVTLQNAAMWTHHYLGCENVLIDGITVHGWSNDNNDGVDIDSCEKVRIANCNTNTVDDGICLKSTADRPCRCVTVTNCVVRSYRNGIKCGTESNGGFQDIAISNCAIYDTDGSGIALEMVDGGDLTRVNVSGITMRNVRGGIFVRLGNRARPIINGGDKPKIGSINDVVIRDVQATGVSAVGCSITGLPGHPVQNITLENIHLRYSGGGSAASIKRDVPEQSAQYPEYSMFGQLPAYGFYVRHAENVRFQHFDLMFEESDPRPAIVCDDVRDLDLQDVKAKIAPTAPACFQLKNVADSLIHDCRPGASDVPFVQLDGPQTDRIRLWNNDLDRMKETVRSGKEVRKQAIEIR